MYYSLPTEVQILSFLVGLFANRREMKNAQVNFCQNHSGHVQRYDD